MIDINFNFHSEVKVGQDPDTKSPTLKKYHKLLWSKALPNGKLFNLKDDKNELYGKSNLYLYHDSDLGFFALGSDAITHSYRNHKRKKHITNQIIDEVNDLFKQGGNIGSYIIFPNKRIENKQTINASRGCLSKIDDRFDLTLECIKRFYKNLDSPLYMTLRRYKAFFDLFENFENYVEFFLLQDLIDNKTNEIKFYLPFDDFKTAPIFRSTDDYLRYKEGVIEFNYKRKIRINNFLKN
ncbi:hypothetical protein N9D26_00200 [bacterium]|nr:hypothetical protein [bacterium]